MKETKNIPRQKLVKGDEVVEPREMSLKAPKSLLKWDGRISWIVKCKYSHNSTLIEAPETFFLLKVTDKGSGNIFSKITTFGIN